MANGSKMKDIPSDDVPDVVKSFVADGKTVIKLTKNQTKGTWDIEAS